MGAAWGWMAATALVMSWEAGQIFGALIIGLVYGGTIGALAGGVLGMPIVIVIDSVRHRVAAWRTLGTVVAAALAPLLSVLMLDDPPWSWSALLVPGAFVIVVGASAWFGLGWIFAAPRDVIPDVPHAARRV